MTWPDTTIRVLHVDDDPEFAELGATFLRREDDRFEIETATGPDRGIEALDSGQFDCVVSDYDMPGENGIEFLERVREAYPDLPFILYTGKGSEEVASDAISAGVTDYLQKESGTDQYTVLANRIKNVVGQYHSQRALDERNQELRRYKQMVNSMHEAACIYDPEGRFEVANEYLAGWYGTTPEALVGTESNLIPRIEADATGDPYRELLTGERRELQGEIEANFPEHGHAVLSYRLTPLFVDGTVEGVVGVARDITERKQRVEELEAMDRRLKAILANTTTPMFMKNTDGEYIFVNRAYRELFDLREVDIVGRTDHEIHPQEIVAAVRSNDRQVIESGRPVETEERIVVDGEERRFLTSKVPIYDTGDRTDTDTPVAVFGVATDITERKAREQELERTNTLLSTLIETLPMGLLVEDASRNLLTVNERLFELLGASRSPDEATETDCERLVADVSDVFTDPERFVTRTDELLAKREQVRNEELSLRDGRTLARSYEPVELPEGDGHLWVYRDVTAQTERERRQEMTIAFLRRLYDVATSRSLDVNEKITRLLDLGPEQLGLPSGYLTRIEASETTPEEGTQRVVEASGDHELLQPDNTCPLEQSYCRRTIGTDEVLAIPDALAAGWEGDPAYELFDLGCYIGTRVTVDDELYGTVFFAAEAPREEPFTEAEEAFVRLVGQLVSYELARDQTQRELRQQNRQLEKFASIVSHDLRSPLTVARGQLQLGREECDNEHFEGVERAHERMSALIRDLLTLAREGERTPETEPVALAECSEGCWRTVETASATLVTDTDRTLTADRSKLQQLLQNLYRNAVEHAGDDVTVTVGDLDTGFYVEDDGPGIPAERRDHVFDTGYSTSADGTGFGLSIVEQIVEAHGWEIRVTEGAEGGARFEITGAEFAS